MKKKWGYKVLRRTHTGNLISAFQTRKQGGRIYTEDEWSVPRKGCGPLGTFPNRGDALEFALQNNEPYYCGQRVIYRCRYKVSERLDYWFTNEMGNIVEAKLRPEFPCDFADAVKITKLVWQEDRR